MGHFRYTIHNLIGHPLMEIAHLCCLRALAYWIHEKTLPKELKQCGALRMTVEAGEYFDRPALTDRELRVLIPTFMEEMDDDART